MKETLIRNQERTITVLETQARIQSVISQAGSEIQETLREHSKLLRPGDSRITLHGIKVFSNSSLTTDATYDLRSGELSFYGAPTSARPEFTREFLVKHYGQVLA